MQDKQEIIIIAAAADNRVIGKGNALPWSIKEDMVHFKKLTMGWPCIMGRKTWESLPGRPLPGRLNIVISGVLKEDNVPPEVEIVPSLHGAIQRCTAYEKIFICGGASIYQQAMALANKIELTVIHQNYEGDVFFPNIDPACWTQISAIDFDIFSFVSYSKVKQEVL